MYRNKAIAIIGVGALVFTACSSGAGEPPAANPASPVPSATPSPSATATVPALADTPSILDTRADGLPDIDLGQFRQLLRRDRILPLYEPQFVTPAEATTPANEPVMGVVINGEAKAYPISPLIFHEMVNDELGGVPILVTW